MDGKLRKIERGDRERGELGVGKEMGHVFFLPKLLLLHLFLIALFNKPPCIHAWGKEGHFMVCKIAQQLLTKNAVAAVQELLPKAAEGELASVCSWADEVRFRYRWSSPLHYVNTPGVCNFRSSRDCHNSKGEEGMCVVGAIKNYTSQLQASSTQYNLTESLMFLAHFMGDVHQPLHAGFEEDEGGNTIRVRWYRRMTNLHHVWDVSIIETAMSDFYNDDLNLMIEAVQANLTDGWSDEVADWKRCSTTTCPNEYASESIKLACDYAYEGVEPESTLGDDYFLRGLPIVEKRIAQGGVRLAALLNKLYKGDAGFKLASN